MPKEIILTDEEVKAIRALKRAAKIWPDTLWLFSASGSLCVMRNKEDGNRACLIDGGLHPSEGVDPDYIVDNIDIENDGGDW